MNRRKSLKRTENKRLPKKKFIVFCEGRNTEPEYIEALQSKLKGTLIEMEIIRGAGTPETITNSAIQKLQSIKKIKKKQSFEEHDQIWVIFDHDAHPNVKQSIQRCRDSKIEIAYSNPCFELWLILHMEEFDKPDDRHQVQKHFKTLHPAYNHKKSANFLQLINSLDQAEERAKAQLARRKEEGIPLNCPCTTVQDFTRALRAAHAQATNK